MNIEQIFSDKTQDKRYDIKDIKEVGKQVKNEYSEKTNELKTDIKKKLDTLKDDVELKAIKEANERTRRLPNNQNKIKSIQEKIKQIKPEGTSTDTLNTITTALQLITGSDETLKTIVGNHETLVDKISKIKSNVLYFQRCGENDWEVLKGLCKECSTDKFSNETLKTVCYLQAMSQDYFNPDYGVDGVVGGNTLRALDSALQLMLPKDTKETDDDKKLQEEQNAKANEIIALDKEINTETDPKKKKELEEKKTKLQEEAKKIVNKRSDIINKKKDPEKKDEKKEEKKEEVKDKKEIKETANVDVETPEILKLKKDITEHFTLNGKEINREKEIANTISIKNGKYTLAINGYTNIQFFYKTEKDQEGKEHSKLIVEKSIGTISKGLLKYNVGEQTIDLDTKGKQEIKTELNQDETKKNIDNQLKNNNKDGDKTPDYKTTAVTDKKITLEYTRNNTEKGKTPITETLDINLDENKNIIPDSQGNGKFSQWQEIKGKKTNTEYILDNKYQLPKAEVLTRYAQSNGEGKMTIINNIQKFEGNGAAKSIYPEHTEMTDVVTNAIKEDFLTNKIERTFTGTLNTRHQEDFTNNWKINKGKTGYELQLSFVANNGKDSVIALPFTENTANNAERTYTFTNNKLTKNIDGIVYDIMVTNINNVPNIKMQENIKETLSEAEKNTKIKLESNIFSDKKEDRENNGNKYKIENLGLSQGPIALETKGGFKRELLLGEKKEGDNIVVAGTKIGEAFFDQDYKLIHVDMKAKDNNEEIDFTKKNNEIEITQTQEDSNGAAKSIFLVPTIKGKTLILNLTQPEDLKKPHRETTEKYKERLREEKELIFLNLRNLSTTLNSKNFLLPTKETDESKYANPIMGPDNNGVYDYKIVNKKDDREAQHIYLQVQGADIKLCNSDGKKSLEKVFVKEPITKDYYTLNVENKKLSAKKIDKDQQEKIPEISNSAINYMSQKVSIHIPKDKITLLNGGTDTYTYGAGGKELVTIYLKDKKLDTSKYTKNPETGILPTNTDTERVNFGSYQNYFSLAGDQSLGITEAAYEAAFKEAYTKNAEKDTGKTIAQIKMRSSKDGKYYYDYMEVKGSEKNISLNTLKGVEKTKTILKERLAQLIKIKSLKLSTKGDQLRGVKLNNTNTTNEETYLKTGTAEFKLSLTANDATASSPEMTLRAEGDSRKLSNNENVSLNQQKINAKLIRKDNNPYIKLDLKEQKAGKTPTETENSNSNQDINNEKQNIIDNKEPTQNIIKDQQIQEPAKNDSNDPAKDTNIPEKKEIIDNTPTKKDVSPITKIEPKRIEIIPTEKEILKKIQLINTTPDNTEKQEESTKELIQTTQEIVAKAGEINSKLNENDQSRIKLANAIDKANNGVLYFNNKITIQNIGNELIKLNIEKPALEATQENMEKNVTEINKKFKKSKSPETSQIIQKQLDSANINLKNINEKVIDNQNKIEINKKKIQELEKENEDILLITKVLTGRERARPNEAQIETKIRDFTSKAAKDLQKLITPQTTP